MRVLTSCTRATATSSITFMKRRDQTHFATKHCHQVAGLLSGDPVSLAESIGGADGIEPVASRLPVSSRRKATVTR